MPPIVTSTIIKQTPPVVLALNPGTRLLGFAILQGEDLLRYGVKTVLTRKTPAELLAVVGKFMTELIEDYELSILAIEKMVVTQQNSALLKVAVEQMKAVATKAQIRICEYAPVAVRKRLCKTGKATKREVANLISNHYPHLRRFYERTRAWELRYYGNLFDAIAVGLVCLEEFQPNDVSALHRILPTNPTSKVSGNV